MPAVPAAASFMNRLRVSLSVLLLMMNPPLIQQAATPLHNGIVAYFDSCLSWYRPPLDEMSPRLIAEVRGN